MLSGILSRKKLTSVFEKFPFWRISGIGLYWRGYWMVWGACLSSGFFLLFGCKCFSADSTTYSALAALVAA